MTAPAMFRRFTPAEVERAVALYHSNLTIDEVGRALGRPYQTVRSVLIRAGVKFRPRGYGNRKLEAAAICDGPIGSLPPTHVLQAVDRVALRDRAIFRRLDIMRRSSGFPATLAAAVVAGIALLGGAADAQQHQHPAAGQHDPYVGYKRPGTNVSCCGGRDCRPVESRFNFTTKQTEILVRSEWRTLDYDKVVGAVPPGADQQMIHACWLDMPAGPGPVLCVFMSGGV